MVGSAIFDCGREDPPAHPLAATRSPFDGTRILDSSLEGQLWLVHTKPRQEKALAADLESLRITVFLPVAKFRRKYGGRTTEVRLPLFPSYLFLRGDLDQRLTALRTHRVVNVIDVVDQDRLSSSLHQILCLTNSTEPVDVYPGIRTGKRCRIIRGSLKGLEGTVIRKRNVCRVSIAVEVLGQSAEVEIDASLLEVIE